MRAIAIAAALLALAAVVSAQLINCATPDGKYDLSGLAGQGDLSGTDKIYNYKFHVCALTTDAGCSGKGGSMCQYDINTGAVGHMLSKWDSSAQYTDCLPATCPNGGVTVTTSNGDVCNGSGGPTRQVIYNIKCPTASSPSSNAYTITNSGCNYVVTMTYAIGGTVCGGPPGPNPDNGGGSGGSKGLSGGSIFLIILVVVIPVYVVVGCVYKRQRQGTSGMESCPNIDFWRDLPSLVGDGFKFTWRKCLGLCGKGDANYEGMK